MLSTWTIQTVSSAQEMDEAFSIRHQVFVEEQGVSPELERDLEDQHAVHFVLYNQGKPSGAGRFREIDSSAKVERVCILREVRGTGAGKALMHAIEQEAFKQGLQTIRLHAQMHAKPFYSQLGYHVTSDEFMDAGIPHVSMEKKLSN